MPHEDPRSYEEIYDDSGFEANPPHLDGAADMSTLIYLDAPNLLHNLECRFKKDAIYTSISKVLIAINPFKTVPIYGQEEINRYRDVATNTNLRLKNELPPHVFTASQNSHFQLVKTGQNQSMVVCGESGSGKTESAKHLMRYLASMSAGEAGGAIGEKSIEKQVLDANPILESFGNAKTLLNNNSSRFGKFTKIIFGDDKAKIVGSLIETYLLEKSRVTAPDGGERNYHVFYMLCRGAGAGSLNSEWASDMKISSNPEDYRYLGGGHGCVTVDGMSDEVMFDEMMSAFTTLGFTDAEQRGVMNCVAAVLHLGNIELEGDDKDVAKLASDARDIVAIVAALYQIETAALLERLTTKKIKLGRELITKPLTVEDTRTNIDAVAKALYHGVFTFVVSCINRQLYEEKARRTNLNWVGILDIFGFESFEHNSFEQFCINYANERLQGFFNAYIIRNEQEEYISEAILWKEIDIPNNQDYLDLVDNRPYGLLAILDASCKTKGTPAAFIQNLFQTFRFHSRMKQVRNVRRHGQKGLIPIEGFMIKHYAGEVIYNAEDFLVKNADAPSDENIALFQSSKCTVTQRLLGPGPGAAAKKPQAGRANNKFVSTGSFFTSQLKLLMETLHQTTPFFVRCIKPNLGKQPGVFDWKYIRPQLECGGILEALRILKCGYPTRCTYDDVFQRYGKIMKPLPDDLNKRDFCEAILRNVGETLNRSEFQLGLTKVFFRPGKQEFMENLLHRPALDEATIMKIKAFMLNKRFQRARGTIQAHNAFGFVYRKMMAERKLKLLLKVGSCVTNSFVEALYKGRQEIAAIRLQAAVRGQLAHANILKQKAACNSILQFYAHNKTRKPIANKLKELVAARIAKQSAAEREEKAKREIARQQRRREQIAAKKEAEVKAKEEEKKAKVLKKRKSLVKMVEEQIEGMDEEAVETLISTKKADVSTVTVSLELQKALARIAELEKENRTLKDENEILKAQVEDSNNKKQLFSDDEDSLDEEALAEAIGKKRAALARAKAKAKENLKRSPSELAEVKEVRQKVQKARKSVFQACTGVQLWEQKLKNSQAKVQQAAKVVQEKEALVLETEKTMALLGIDLDAQPKKKIKDPTALKLIKLRQERRAEMEAAEKIMDDATEVMVEVATNMNSNIETLEEKTNVLGEQTRDEATILGKNGKKADNGCSVS